MSVKYVSACKNTATWTPSDELQAPSQLGGYAVQVLDTSCRYSNSRCVCKICICMQKYSYLDMGRIGTNWWLPPGKERYHPKITWTRYSGRTICRCLSVSFNSIVSHQQLYHPLKHEKIMSCCTADFDMHFALGYTFAMHHQKSLISWVRFGTQILNSVPNLNVQLGFAQWVATIDYSIFKM